MFKTPVAISSEKHARTRFVPADNYQFASELTHVQLLGGEILEASKYYPVVFDLKTGSPLVVLGLTAQKNLYLDEQFRWRVPYIPACCSCYPFALSRISADNGSTQYIVTMDESAETLQQEKGKLLFNKNGTNGYRASPLLKALKERLVEIEENLHKTQAIFAQLVEHDVLVAKQVRFSIDGRENRLDGFAAVDWDKVQHLSSDVLAQWQQSGVMDALQAHTASMDRFNLLGQLLEQG